MQMPTQDNRHPVLPASQTPAAGEAPARPVPGRRPERYARKRRGRFMLFMRGYLMLVGGMTTLYVLIKLVVLLFVELARWMPAQPML